MIFFFVYVYIVYYIPTVIFTVNHFY